MAKTMTAKQAALAKARERRLELDAERDERDRSIEDAAAEVFLLLADRAEAESKVARANIAISKALRRVTDEGLAVDAVAKLIDRAPAEVRGLLKASRNGESATTANQTCRLPRAWDRLEPGFATVMGPPGLPVMGPPACRAPDWCRPAVSDHVTDVDVEVAGGVPGGSSERDSRGAALLAGR